MNDSLKWLRSQQEVYRHIGSSHASGQYKAAADEIERLQAERDEAYAAYRIEHLGRSVDAKAYRAEIERLQAIVEKLPTEIEWQAIIDALEFTSTRSGCVSDAHIRVVDKIQALRKAAEAGGE